MPVTNIDESDEEYEERLNHWLKHTSPENRKKHYDENDKGGCMSLIIALFIPIIAIIAYIIK